MKNRVRLIRWADDPIDAERDILYKDDYYRRYRGNRYLHPTDGVWPHDRAQMIVNEFIGKPFAKAFSKFCSFVPKYHQRIFLDMFRDRRWYRRQYDIDDDGNIMDLSEKRERPKTIFYSLDYLTEERHVVTGRAFDWWRDRWKTPYKPEDWVKTVVSGWSETFDSRQDRRFKRLMWEKRKDKKKRDREFRRNMSERAYSFLTKSEKEERAGREANRAKILKHGFDLRTSFRGNGVSPESISDDRGY